MPVAYAASIWNSISLFCLITSVYVIVKNFYTKIKLSAMLIILSSILLLSPVRETFLFGQNNIVVLFLLLLSFLLSQKKTYQIKILSGVCIGLASSLKIFPIFLVLFFLVRKEWIRAGMSITVWVIFSLLGTFGHVSYIWEYVHYGFSIIHASRPYPSDASFAAMLLTFSPTIGIFRDFVMSIFSIVFFLMAFITSKRMGKNELAGFIFFSSILAETVLIMTPLAWNHHLVFLIPLCLGLFFQIVSTKKIVYVLLFLLGFFSIFISWEHFVIPLQTAGVGYFPFLSFHACIGLTLLIVGEFLLSFQSLQKEKA